MTSSTPGAFRGKFVTSYLCLLHDKLYAACRPMSGGTPVPTSQFEGRPKQRWNIGSPVRSADSPRTSRGRDDAHVRMLADIDRTFMRGAEFAMPMRAEPVVRVAWTVALAALLASAGMLLGTSRAADAAAPPSAPFAWDLGTPDPGPGTGLYTSVALNGSGAPFISYINSSDGTVRVAHRTDGTWTSEVIAGPGISYGNTNVAVSRSGTVQVSYFDAVQGTVEYAVRNNTGWKTTRIDTGFTEGYDRLALNSAGVPAIVYTGFDGSLRYAAWNGSAWSIQIVDDTTITCRYPDLAFDPLDRPQISYYGNGMLLYASKNHGVWSHTVVDPTSFAGWFSRIRVDPRDVAHIAYYASANGTLMFATEGADGWDRGVIDSEGDVGYDLSFVLDANDRAQVAYYDRTAGHLRYAMETPQGWVRETVDDMGVVGWYTGIAVDPNGLPHISYYDYTHDDLRYAEGIVGLEVRTLAPSLINATSAILRGELVALGNYSRTSVGFAFRPAHNATWLQVGAGNLTSAGTFSIRLVGLTPGVTYEYRAFGTGGNETSEGVTRSFRLSVPVQPTPPYGLIIGVAGGIAVACVLTFLAVRQWQRRPSKPVGPKRR